MIHSGCAARELKDQIVRLDLANGSGVTTEFYYYY